MAREIPTEAQVLEWYRSLSNWGRWGPADELGTLNLITPEKRLQAAALVREGLAISCARTIGYQPGLDGASPPQHFMLRSGEGIVSRGVLLDIARLKGVDWLDPTDAVFPEDLEAAEAAQGVQVEPGDILFVRTGNPKQRAIQGAAASANGIRPSQSCGSA
jgi:hypothetical protein